MRPAVWILAAVVAASGVQGQRPRIRFGPGVCGPIDPVYIKTATATGGQPFPMSTTEVGASSRVMEASLLRDLILWASGEREQTYSLPIDSTVARVMFSATFDATGGSLTLIAPDGAEWQAGDRMDDTTLNCGRIATLDKPMSGMWQARVVPSGHFWLAVHANSALSMSDAAFVEPGDAPDGFVRIEGEPIAGSVATLRASVSPALNDPSFQFVSIGAEPLQSLALRASDGHAFSGTTTMPAEPFRLLVAGTDDQGNRTQRIWPFVFHAEPVEIVPPADATIAAGASTPVTFTIRNHGAAVRLNLVSSNNRGEVVAVDPPSLELAAGGE